MNKTLHNLQFRAIRESLKSYGNAQIHLSHAVNDTRIIGKNINDINLKPEFKIRHWELITTKGAEFRKSTIDYKAADKILNHTIYVISKDWRIIYVKESTIHAPAMDAFRVLTGVFYSHYEEGTPVYKSPEPARGVKDITEQRPIKIDQVPASEMNYDKCFKGMYWF